MTSRERVRAAVRHEAPDRVPMDYWARQDLTERLIAFTGVAAVEELYRRLRVDLRPIAIHEHVPEFECRVTGVLPGRSPYAGRRFILYDDGRFEDAWGVVRRVGSDGLYDEWVSGPFAESTDLDAFAWPQGDLFDSVETLRARAAQHRGEFALIGAIDLPFKVAWHLRGMENFLCDMLADPPFARELLQRAAAYQTEKAVRLARAGVDIIGIYGDLAMQDRMLVQPAAWRDLEKPILADMVRQIRAANPEALVFFHSDGDVTEIIPDYIDVGADILNPIQPECMDPAAVKRRFGARITLHGTISIQRTLPHGTAEDVRREVADRIAACGDGGGLILCPANVMQNDTPLENILALYDAPRA